MQRKKGANLMKNLFKKIGALLVAAVMVLSMCTAVFAVTPAKITVNNLDSDATISYLQIIIPDQTKETGWKFTDGVANEFKKVTAWANLSDQQILWSLIKYENNGAIVPNDTITIGASEIQNALGNVETNLAGKYTPVVGSEITATEAGVYAIKAMTTNTKNEYLYSPMAAFVSFETYNPTTGVPTNLKNETVNAKKTTNITEKTSSEKDGVVEIGKEVTYTVKTTVPYITDDVANVTYTITDEITGAEYSLAKDGANKGKLEVSVKIGNNIIDIPALEVKTENGKQTFVLNLSAVAADRKNANKTVEISYKAIVKSEKVENSVEPNGGTHKFKPATNTLYTGKITMTKKDDNKEKAVKLADAGFVIYRVDGAKTYYALVSKDDEKTNNEYVVTGWTERFDTAKADGNLIMTDSNGEAVVRGLDDSYHYSFKEIKAPEGYSVNTTDSVATWGTNQTAENRTGTATMSDTKLNSLPSTGGMGTYLFTIIGVVVMAGAAGAFFISRRKGSEE
jgi:fimbrial isopeptide formation D2 family protein/LPXTG-motif cell wall-anchored protein